MGLRGLCVRGLKPANLTAGPAKGTLLMMKPLTCSLVAAATFLLCACNTAEVDDQDDRPGSGDGDDDQGETGSGGQSNPDEPMYFLVGIRLVEGSCLPREISVDGAGNSPCKLLDLAGPGFDCEASGLLNVSTALVDAALTQLEIDGICGDDTGLLCEGAFTVCELPELEGEEAQLCSTDASDPGTFESVGFCYVDDPESPLLSDCAPTEMRTLRGVGPGIPLQGGPDYLACGN